MKEKRPTLSGPDLAALVLVCIVTVLLGALIALPYYQECRWLYVRLVLS